MSTERSIAEAQRILAQASEGEAAIIQAMYESLRADGHCAEDALRVAVYQFMKLE